MFTREGSSPLSRGIQQIPRDKRFKRRIIPALAGNTVRVVGCGRRTADHPRSRGEYPKRKVTIDPDSGSSPLSRGILCEDEDEGEFIGIIPALAGNTSRPIHRGIG